MFWFLENRDSLGSKTKWSESESEKIKNFTTLMYCIDIGMESIWSVLHYPDESDTVLTISFILLTKY